MFILDSDRTDKRILKIVETLNFKGYEQYFKRDSYGNFNPAHHFFIWAKKNNRGVVSNPNNFIRICLSSNGFHSDRVYYWNVDFNFVPFNKKKCDKWKSEPFKDTAEDLYLSRFNESIKKIEDWIESDRCKK